MNTKNIALIVLLAALSCQSGTTKEEKAVNTEEIEVNKKPVKDGVFVHISSGYEDAHRVLMPMKMATMMAVDQDVLVYMDIDAVKLLARDAEDLNHDSFDSFQTYVSRLVEAGVGIYACPTCLEVAGIDSDNLMEGVQLASKERFFDFTEGRIITLDY
jgi:predicted peroxiredoxin